MITSPHAETDRSAAHTKNVTRIITVCSRRPHAASVSLPNDALNIVRIGEDLSKHELFIADVMLLTLCVRVWTIHFTELLSLVARGRTINFDFEPSEMLLITIVVGAAVAVAKFGYSGEIIIGDRPICFDLVCRVVKRRAAKGCSLLGTWLCPSHQLLVESKQYA